MITFLKFFGVGIVNTTVDFAVLNVLIFSFGIGSHGEHYAYFKAFSFFVAVVNSYFLNKYWVFATSAASRRSEPVLFLLVSMVGFLLNVATSYEVFRSTTESGLLTHTLAANVGAFVGSVTVLLWNFLGYKFFVFTKPHD